MAAAVVLAVAGTGVIGYWSGTKVNASDDPLVASHVRSLLGDHLTDVASSDRHTVKPWLDARLDYAPPVIDLAADSLPLIGGRLDYLSHRPVAVLVYQRRQHIINVYIAPAGALAAGLGRGALERGYHVKRWRTGGMDAVSISDVEPKELTRFSELFQQRVAAADVDLP